MKTAPLLVSFEVGDKIAMGTQKGFHGVSGAVAEVQPNYFRRVAIEEAAVAEVGIFGDDHESISLGVFPNGGIVPFMQMKREQMVRVGKQIGKAPNQLWREVVVVQKLHAGRLRGLFEGGRIGQTSLDIRARQVWEIVQHFLDAHAGRQILKDILNGHPHAANAGLPAPLPRLERNVLPPVDFHGRNMQEGRAVVNFLAWSVWWLG